MSAPCARVYSVYLAARTTCGFLVRAASGACESGFLKKFAGLLTFSAELTNSAAKTCCLLGKIPLLTPTPSGGERGMRQQRAQQLALQDPMARVGVRTQHDTKGSERSGGGAEGRAVQRILVRLLPRGGGARSRIARRRLAVSTCLYAASLQAGAGTPPSGMQGFKWLGQFEATRGGAVPHGWDRVIGGGRAAATQKNVILLAPQCGTTTRVRKGCPLRAYFRGGKVPTLRRVERPKPRAPRLTFVFPPSRQALRRAAAQAVKRNVRTSASAAATRAARNVLATNVAG